RAQRFRGQGLKRFTQAPLRLLDDGDLLRRGAPLRGELRVQGRPGGTLPSELVLPDLELAPNLAEIRFELSEAHRALLEPCAELAGAFGGLRQAVEPRGARDQPAGREADEEPDGRARTRKDQRVSEIDGQLGHRRRRMTRG